MGRPVRKFELRNSGHLTHPPNLRASVNLRRHRLGFARSIAALVTASLVLSACVSGRPRPYAPSLSTPVSDPALYERDFGDCSSRVAAGERAFGNSPAAAAVGTVGSIAAVQTLSGVATTAAVGSSAPLALAGVGLVILVPVATYRLSSARRSRNEREVQRAMTECLAQRGYFVSGWSLVSRARARDLTTVTPTQSPAPAEPQVQ